ncbi:MAG: hypothetical protein MUE37_09010 [Bacteroidales bacterium]|jgi:hypothetical protein|nr:hypothetical protein [Bacteroidales bacterium]
MKASVFSLSLIVLFCLASLQSCEVFAGGDECKGSEMDMVEPVIYLKANFYPVPITIEPYTNLNESEEMIISGSIQKEYCSGKLSGYFTFNPTFFPNEMTLNDFAEGFYFPQSYQYKFNNKEDELIVILRIKAYTYDGRIFESEDAVMRFKYADIKYDVNMIRNYIKFTIPKNIEWYRVTI